MTITTTKHPGQPGFVHPRDLRGWTLIASGVDSSGATFESWQNTELLAQLACEDEAKKQRNAEIAEWAERAAEAREQERRRPTLVRCSCPFACFVHRLSVLRGLGPL